MDTLKRDVETKNKEVETERKKNVDLLYSIFPEEVARTLWSGNIPYICSLTENGVLVVKLTF